MMDKFSQEIEASGHLIDSLILTKIFDKVMDLQGEFKVQEIKIGQRKKDSSYVRLLVFGNDQAHLDKILETIHRVGAVQKNQKEIILKKSLKNNVMPDNFYSTTNNQTQIFYKKKWIPVKNMMMDKCIVLYNGDAFCTAIRDVKKGDQIVTGDDGIKVTPPERPREGLNVFEFMGNSSSSERPTQHIAKKVADDIYAIRKKGGKIILVGGPAIIHTGASSAVSELIKLGYVQGLLAGNALAVHDVEHAILGTSLGMNVHDATLAYHGHRNHMDIVNMVFKSGSIKNMVKSGKLKSGIMYECIKNKVPFVLAGSIRDDGPLPDVITDVVLAQKEYKKILKGADMVIMISTMLHSIATGNMLPANVKVIVVDINQPTVTKLMDRGTWQALGIVSDVGAFLPIVTRHIQEKH